MASKKTTKRRKLIIGNWKMNPTTAEEARRIYTTIKRTAAKLEHTDTVACPPFAYLGLFKKSASIGLGAQNVFSEEAGAYTGEVSAHMLASLGATHVIIGHSERRTGLGLGAGYGESDEIVAKKVSEALLHGLIAVVCVGESVRDEHGEYLDTLKQQLKNSLAKVARKDLSRIVIAYEPVWAIGAKEAMTPQAIHETSIFIKKNLADMYGQEEALKVPILYGGSVNFRNAKDIVEFGQVDGLLVGRESVNPPGFVDILKVIDQIS